MRKRAGSWGVALLLPCLVTTPGCLVYRRDRQPNLIATGAKATAPIAPRINVVFHCHHYPGSGVGFEYSVKASWEGVRKATPFLANASTDIPTPDFVLDLDVTRSMEGESFLGPPPPSPTGLGGIGVALAIVVGVWPVVYTDTASVRATLTTPAGETLGTHEASGQLKMVAHLLFIPVSPISLFMSARLLDDTFRDVLIPIAQDLVVATEDPSRTGGERMDSDRTD